MFKINDKVQLIRGAKFISGNAVADKFIEVELMVADIVADNYVIKTENDVVIGTVLANYVAKYSEANAVVIDPYHALVIVSDAEIHAEPNANSEVLKTVAKHSMFKIVNEIKGWGKLELGKGWINLKDTKIYK